MYVQCVGSRMDNGGRTIVNTMTSSNGMILEPRARQLPDESVVMRYPTRAYQTDQPSAYRPFCYQHIVQTRIFYKPLDRSNTYQCHELEVRWVTGLRGPR